MRAIVYRRYGAPEVLALEEVAKPTPGDAEVLVRVHAAAANAGDRHLMRGEPFLVRLALGGLWRPRHRVLGSDIAGQVEAVGRNVRQFEPGQAVFGDLSGCGFGGFAEYACAPEKALAPKPAGTTFEEAAALPVAARSALQALRDEGRVRPGQKVLINGASGGVGTFAVQLARALGAEVTGVCSTRNLELVRSLGAERVIDYTREDFTRGGQRFDLILDAAAHHPLSALRRALAPGGTYVMIGGATRRTLELMLLGPWLSRLGARRMRLLLSQPRQEDLVFLKALVEAGRLRPVIERCYTLREVPEALRVLEQGHVRGKLVVRVCEAPERPSDGGRS